MYSQIYNWPNLTLKYQLNISEQNYNILSGIMLFFKEVESFVDYNVALLFQFKQKPVAKAKITLKI
jgi:hypothetical protein